MKHNHNSLYRVYRPVSFDDVAGHKNIIEILKTQLDKQTFSHAFLFAGQRGTGKTSIARILAKSINCLNLDYGNPCNNCNNCLAFNDNKFSDVYEIDAASNNGVDEIRNIKANISTLPIIGQFKVYIIDEVHMLTKGAFNALLKTLEEPPTHAIFILATTEYDKIPQTIISRCQTFSFKKINQSDLVDRLNFIAKNEGYVLDIEVGQEIYNISDGSLRDALNVVEQLMILSDDKHLNLVNLKKIFYVTTLEEKLTLLGHIFNQDAKQTITYFEYAKRQGMDFEAFSLSLLKIIKEMIEFKLTDNKTLLNEINQNDYQKFKDVELKDWFLLSDYLTSAYSNTKSHSISYDAIILSIIQSTQNFSKKYQIKVAKLEQDNQVNETDNSGINLDENNNLDNNQITEEENNEVIEENIIEEVVLETIEPDEPEIKWSQDIINDLIKNNEQKDELVNNNQISNDFIDEELVPSPTLIDNYLTEKKEIPLVVEFNQSDEPVLNLLDLINKQNNLIVDNSNSINNIEFLIEDLINVLRGAVVDQTIMLRKTINEKIQQLFNVNDNNELLTPVQANKFLLFYNSKVVVANNHEMILTVDDQMSANVLNKWLVNEENRLSLFSLLQQQFVVYVISEQLWKETKLTHNRLKDKQLLNDYHQIKLINFYEQNNQVVNQKLSVEQQDVIDKISDLFDGQDIKIG